MSVDIRELARRCGVSVATVSRALNDRPEVSATTRALVRQMARDLGYLPNTQARALVRRRSDMVGLIWDTSYVETRGRQPFLQDLLVGLKMALADSGYHLMLLSPRTAEVGDDAFVRVAAQHALDGVALMGVDEHLPALAKLIGSGRPCIGLDLPVRGLRATYVSTDNEAAAGAAVEHLVGLGHRRIATITGPLEMMPSAQRAAGFRTAMRRHRLRVQAAYVEHGDFFLPSGSACMRRLLDLPEPPTAVFVAGDEMAIGALHAVADAGLRVPDDISIVGYDDIEHASLVRPALTTVAQDYLGLGAAAVATLTRLIDGTLGDSPPPVTLPGRLVVRDSTAPPRS